MRDPETNAADGVLDIFEGPCCESPLCVARELWPYDGETHTQFLARLTSKYGAHPLTEVQPS